MATLAEERAAISDFYGDNYCLEEQEDTPNTAKKISTLLENLEEAIYFYSEMLHSAIERNDSREVALCKKELQEAKINKRRLLAS